MGSGPCTGFRRSGFTDEGYDIAVIGAGSAGFSAAIAAADAGARVGLIGDGVIGGTCVNVGCVPSKTMIRAAEALHGGNTAGRFAGIAGEARLVDRRALVGAKDELVSRLRRGKYADLLPHYPGIRYIEGRARFGCGELLVGGVPLRTERTIVTTGASPAVPDIPGVGEVSALTSTTALEMTEQPRSLLVIGGGYVGCELAQMFARLGTAVTLVTRSRLLPAAEPEVADALAGHLRDEGLAVRDHHECIRIAGHADGVALEVRAGSGEEVLTAERVLVATGRTPNTAGLGLETTGIATDDRGAIRVDARMRTTRAGVYAAGDVTGRDQFVYMAAYGAGIAAENALHGDRRVYDHALVPWVVFTDPQVAAVGLSAARARAEGHDVATSVLPLDQLPRALAARDTRGLVKLVADAGSDRLLGAQILAPEGADAIQTAAMALRFRMTSQELGKTIFPYLTTVEGLRLAAQGFSRDVTRLSCCA